MVHPYPTLCRTFPYVGRVSYFVTFKTHEREPFFREPDVVELVLAQFQRAADEQAFDMLIYCFMPDHVHLVIRGRLDRSDAKAFFRRAKQGWSYLQISIQPRCWSETQRSQSPRLPN
jgi:REP element-mobilizing transposase RayT